MTVRKQTVYQLAVNSKTRSADIIIYGDITRFAETLKRWYGDDENIAEVSARGIIKEINDLDVDDINVYINSYGGEVAEALAIYSALKRHSASVHTYCDGFACSAATIIFCVGDVRTMGTISMMMIHNAMTIGYGNAEELRKTADDIEKITQSSVEAYKLVSNLSEDEIKEMMNRETWMTAQEALDYGFATEIADRDPDDEDPEQAAFMSIREAVLSRQKPVDFSPVFERLDALTKIVEDLHKEVEPEPVKPVNIYKRNFMKYLGGN